jgi:hypothetical protein
VYSLGTPVCNFSLDGSQPLSRLLRVVSQSEGHVNKWLAAAGLALVILTGAMGLKAVANQAFAHTSAPVPPTPYFAHTSAPVPPTPY